MERRLGERGDRGGAAAWEDVPAAEDGCAGQSLIDTRCGGWLGTGHWTEELGAARDGGMKTKCLGASSGPLLRGDEAVCVI
jgi:hypothetical protein